MLVVKHVKCKRKYDEKVSYMLQLCSKLPLKPWSKATSTILSIKKQHTYGSWKYWNDRRLTILHQNFKIGRWTFNTEREIHLAKVQRSWVWKELITSLWNCRVLEKNLFVLPSGKAGRKFIGEVSKLMSEWLQDSPLKDIAFKVTCHWRILCLKQ